MALRPCEQARHIYLHEPIYQSEMFDAGMARIEAILSSEVQVARLKDGARSGRTSSSPAGHHHRSSSSNGRTVPHAGIPAAEPSHYVCVPPSWP